MLRRTLPYTAGLMVCLLFAVLGIVLGLGAATAMLLKMQNPIACSGSAW